MFFKYVNSKTKLVSKIPDLYLSDDMDKDLMTSSDQEKANEFAKFFSSVQTNEPPGTWSPPLKPEVSKLLLLELTEESLMTKLNNLKTNKSPGADGIHPRVLYEIRKVLVKPFLYIFKHQSEQLTFLTPGGMLTSQPFSRRKETNMLQEITDQ